MGGIDNSPAGIFNYIITCSIASFCEFDVVKIDNEYNGYYYLSASLYSVMSELVFE